MRSSIRWDWKFLAVTGVAKSLGPFAPLNPAPPMDVDARLQDEMVQTSLEHTKNAN